MAERLLIIWQRYGPYHYARLRAATYKLNLHNIQVTGLEIASDDRMHQWEKHNDEESCFHKTLFADRSYHDLKRREIARSVTEALDETCPDYIAIDGWSSGEAVAALKWCKVNSKHPILMSESKEDDSQRQWYKEMFKSSRVKKYTSAIVGGKPHKEYAEKLGVPGDKIFLGYDVIDNEYFEKESGRARGDSIRLRNELCLPERYFLSVGRFLDFKNLSRFIEAYNVYREACDAEEAWGLVICGTGPLENELKAVAEGNDGIVWTGFRQIDELPQYYGLASAFVLPSSREQWGLVVNEAMACGLPLIVSDRAGCRYDLLNDGENGYLCDPYDTLEMANVLHKMAKQSEERIVAMGKSSRNIISNWNVGRFGDALWSAVQACGEVKSL